jgi:hypothetical protein
MAWIRETVLDQQLTEAFDRKRYSGITQWWAAPAMVGRRAVNPAYRPKTLVTGNLSWDPGDVLRECVMRIVLVTQVLKPMQ